MLKNWINELLYPVPKAADVLPLFSTVTNLPAPELPGVEYSQPCEIGKLHEDGRLEVLASTVRLRFTDQQWTKDSTSHEHIAYPATHWRFVPQ